MFISAVDSTIVNVGLPEISRDLNARLGGLQWIIDGFLVCLGGMLLVGSGLADRFGRRRVFLCGVAGFGATSVLAALSQTTGELIAARVLMGAAAACVLPPALSLVAVMFPPEERPRALAVWTTVAGLGFALGPVLGGLLVPSVGWQAVFLVNVPVAIVAVPLGIYALPESRRPGAPPLDLIGVGLSIIALASIVFALIDGVHAGWTDPLVLTAALVGLVAGVSFVRLELVRDDPLFDVSLLARRVVAAGAVVILAVYISFLGLLFLLPQYLHYVHHQSTLLSGLTLAPLGVGTLITAPFTGAVVTRLGARVTIAGALGVMSASVALLLLLHRDTTVLIVLASLGLFGAMIPMTVTPATGVIMGDLEDAKAGDGGAINQLARQVGGALGVAIIGSVLAEIYAHRIVNQLGGFSLAVRQRAMQSIAATQKAISHTGATLHAQLLVRIAHAFDVGARVGFAVATALLLAAAVVAAVALDGRRERGIHQVVRAISKPGAPPVAEGHEISA
jgi:EmrB/QacA subfamily drug resistance transporter